MASSLSRGGYHYGCDPEFFFTLGDQIIGAEKVIGQGLKGSYDWCSGKGFTLDGVQVELNPSPSHCRANLANEIRDSFRSLRDHLALLRQSKGIEFKASFRTVVEVTEEELATLGESARVLGCQPSLNIYDRKAQIGVDPTAYLKRSAGGHIHLGVLPALQNPRLVTLLDLFVGNTMVLIDRDPNAPERRKVYGRAGEYRLPPHGVEYRTLSNFWLRSYPLMSLVFGLARMACDILYTTQAKHWDAEADVLGRFTTVTTDAGNRVVPDVREAINHNDLELATRNWQALKPFIMERCEMARDSLGGNYMEAFEHFLHATQQHGLEYWFPDDPLTHWIRSPEGHGTGWESFLVQKVAPRMGATHV